MYRVLLADDEGIVIDSLIFMIERNLKGECVIESAKTGRAAIELGESFRPDIVFMDIQMPGINGIEAMKEMQLRNPDIIFIVLSAYDKFNYARQAIDLKVQEYLMKPVSSEKVTQTLRIAMHQIDARRKKMSDDLAVKEKLQTVIPVLENSFIYGLIFQNVNSVQIANYKNLLDIEHCCGNVFILEYGDDQQGGILTNPAGASVKIHKIYDELKETVKEYWPAIVSSPMGNRMIWYVPREACRLEYNVRIQMIENARALIRRLTRKYQMFYKMGIGSVRELEEIHLSYNEALEALQYSKGNVTHIKDIESGCTYEQDYPVELEKSIFEAVKKGSIGEAQNAAARFFQWMGDNTQVDIDSIRLKTLEFVLWAEHLAYENGGLTYHFTDRKNYLSVILQSGDLKHLKTWFLDKIKEAARNISQKQEKQASTLVMQAEAYIKKNFSTDLSLYVVARHVNISPYYFSKLFKEGRGENYVDYVTKMRISHAKGLLQDTQKSIKEICLESGYSDPNYFSRTFKKCTGLTPSEYREGGRIYEG